jgi:hypothetical protein
MATDDGIPRQHPLNEQVDELLARWQHQRQDLQDASRALEAALAAFARGDGPEPLAERDLVDRLRTECDALFSGLMESVRAAKEAGVRK